MDFCSVDLSHLLVLRDHREVVRRSDVQDSNDAHDLTLTSVRSRVGVQELVVWLGGDAAGLLLDYQGLDALGDPVLGPDEEEVTGVE